MITPGYGLTATERVLPKLALDFTTAALDSRVTITRALNTATCVGSNGLMQIVNANLPRFDFSPVNVGSCNGLLIEESRINICQYSEDLSNAAWNKTFSGGVTVNPNQANGPDGASNLDLITSSAIGGKVFQILPTLSFSTQYSVSCFVRAGSATTSSLSIFSTAAGEYVGVNFSWSGNVPSTASLIGTPTNVQYTNFGGGLYRVSFTFSSRSSGDHWVLYTPDISAGLGTSYTGYFQVELGAFVTSYIPNLTTGATTRNADAVSMTGTNFSDWYNATEGTLQVIGSMNTASTSIFQVFAMLGDANNGLQIFNNLSASRFRGDIYSGGAIQKAFTYTAAGAPASGTTYNIIVGLKANDFAMAINGNTVATANSGLMPVSPSALYIGSYNPGVQFLGGYIRKLAYYKQKLTNAEIQAFSK